MMERERQQSDSLVDGQASCTCRKCFEGVEKAKEAAKAARQAKIAAARGGGGTRAAGGGGARAGSGAGLESFATVGEVLVPLKGAEDVARYGLSSNKMAPITSNCDRTRSSSIKWP